MGCATCSTGGCGSGPEMAGCGSGGSCKCNRLNTFDWLSNIELPELDQFNVVEVSFKSGARKGFYLNHFSSRAIIGDMVVVESGNGFDVGSITLSGELVKLQMKKKRVKETAMLPSIIRRANERDIERLEDARGQEQQAMVLARAISHQLKLDMKIGDVEYQGDRRKATFYYTADGRVDFRELIKLFAKEFRVKIEMRQIGARQESARIGGIGSCGRELCCSTWLTDFKSVSTAAARYQNLAINQAKLSGQCGRLKCCLNFELDTYMDALEDFPDKADKLETEAGSAVLIKTDIFKRTLYYIYRKEGFTKSYALSVERVKEILAMNKKGTKPMELNSSKMLAAELEENVGYGDLTGVVELSDLEKHNKTKRRRKRGNTDRAKDGKSSNSSNTPRNRTEQRKSSTKPKQDNKNTPIDKLNNRKGSNRSNNNRNQSSTKKSSNEGNPPSKKKTTRHPNQKKPNQTNRGNQENRRSEGDDISPKTPITGDKPVNKSGTNNRSNNRNPQNKNENKPPRNRNRRNRPNKNTNPDNKPNPQNNTTPNKKEDNQQENVQKKTNNRRNRNRNRNFRKKKGDDES